MEHDTPAGGGRRRVRSDALANRERVLAAAVTAVLREGRQVPMGTIAAEAGVGIGTLYRRYPNREVLLEALTLRAFRLVLQCAEDAENSPATPTVGYVRRGRPAALVPGRGLASNRFPWAFARGNPTT